MYRDNNQKSELYPEEGALYVNNATGRIWFVVFVWRNKLLSADDRLTIQRVEPTDTNLKNFKVNPHGLNILIGSPETIHFDDFQLQFTPIAESTFWRKSGRCYSLWKIEE